MDSHEGNGTVGNSAGNGVGNGASESLLPPPPVQPNVEPEERQGCLVVRQPFFHNPKNFVDVGGGILGCRGFHSSFRTTQGGLSLNIDVSTTVIIQPGPVVDFLIANQNVKDPFQIDWAKVAIFRETDPEEFEDKDQSYCVQNIWTERKAMQRADVCFLDIDCLFLWARCIDQQSFSNYTAHSKHDCCLLSGKLLKSTITTQSLCCVLVAFQSINNNFTQVEGRVLLAPKLKGGNGEDFFLRNDRWNFNNKKFVEPATLERWAVVNFSARSDVRGLIRDLTRIGESKGILGGLNSLLSVEGSPSMPLISKVHTMIIGMDVSHGSPGQSDVPLIAAVFSSRNWPFISRYWASVRTQSPEVEMIDLLYKRVSDTEDDGIS
ncbi:hypothetical protein RHGRI_002152 [Rhododendron griersonianum]|uniref:Argonaute linker 1 domain-containing protein n=1 Tax=Rhododendron griersonianum TaxID=479676 RepID=A0AAV6LNJ2_9ERIC|nr:hypothetical protein RHGRI_002152 [Rhododendron griersonianum]